MDCVQFKEIYQELDRPGTTGFRFRERALAHAESCAGCGALLTDGEALDFALRNLAQQTRQQPDGERSAAMQIWRTNEDAASQARVQQR